MFRIEPQMVDHRQERRFELISITQKRRAILGRKVFCESTVETVDNNFHKDFAGRGKFFHFPSPFKNCIDGLCRGFVAAVKHVGVDRQRYVRRAVAEAP
jgi:hypothetical protein